MWGLVLRVLPDGVATPSWPEVGGAPCVPAPPFRWDGGVDE